MHYLSLEFGILFIGFLWVYWWLGARLGNHAQDALLLLASYLFYATFSVQFALQLCLFSLAILTLARYCSPKAALLILGAPASAKTKPPFSKWSLSPTAAAGLGARAAKSAQNCKARTDIVLGLGERNGRKLSNRAIAHPSTRIDAS